MARIRTIKPEFWTSAQVMECTPLTRLMFIGMWNFADDHGRMALSPKTIKAQIFPSDNFSADRILGMIRELSKNGLVEIYAVEGKEVLQVTGWKHQRIDKPQASKLPPPVADNSTNGLGTFTAGEEGSLRELKGKERNGDAADAAPPKVGNGKYAFESGVIKLNQRDLDQWVDAYKNLDVKAELLALTEWAGQQRNWFNAVKGALTKKNRDIKTDREKPQRPSDWRDSLV